MCVALFKAPGAVPSGWHIVFCLHPWQPALVGFFLSVTFPPFLPQDLSINVSWWQIKTCKHMYYVVWHYSWRDVTKCPWVPDREPMADQRKGTMKVHLSEAMSSIGVTYRKMGEGLLRGAEKTQRQLYHKSSPHPSMGGRLPKAGKQEGTTQGWGSSRVEGNPFQ